MSRLTPLLPIRLSRQVPGPLFGQASARDDFHHQSLPPGAFSLPPQSALQVPVRQGLTPGRPRGEAQHLYRSPPQFLAQTRQTSLPLFQKIWHMACCRRP